MAVEGSPHIAWSFVSGGAIGQYVYVKLSANNTVVVCSGTTDRAIGVSQDAIVTADIGSPVNVCLLGITKLQGDADLGYGDSIGTSADGQAAAYTATDTTKHINGVVLIDNGAAAGLITAAIDCINTRTLA
jgi:hypothetical protein